MATEEQHSKIRQLIDQVGGLTNASRAIASVKLNNYAPTKSGLGKLYRGDRSPNEYIMQCYIDDLEKAIGGQSNE